MTDRAERKRLLAEYKQHGPQAGVYRIVNRCTDRALIGSTLNLGSVRGKLEFARATHTTGGLDHRLNHDIRAFGIDAFEFEILEVLEASPDRTPAGVREDLATLETLWREKLHPTSTY